MLKNRRIRLSLVLKISSIIFVAFALVLGNEIRLGVNRYKKNTIESDAASTVRLIDSFSKEYINLNTIKTYDLSSSEFEQIYDVALGGNYQLIKSLVSPDGKILNLSREVDDTTTLCMLLTQFKGNKDWPVYINLESIGQENIEKLEEYFVENDNSKNATLSVVFEEPINPSQNEYNHIKISSVKIDNDEVITCDVKGKVEKLSGRLSFYSSLYKEIYFSNNTQSLSHGNYSHSVTDNSKTVVIDYRNAIKGIQQQIQKHFDEYTKAENIFASTAYADYYLLKPYRYHGKTYSSVMVKMIDWNHYNFLYHDNLYDTPGATTEKLSEKDQIKQSITGYFIVTQEYDHLFASSMQQFMLDNSSTYFLALILIACICLAVAYWIIKPVHRLETTAKHIARKEFDYPIDVSRRDELGDLSRSIDTMSKELEKTINNLYKEVEKVKQLENLRQEFVSNFTHEIKTPLGVINGFSELVELEQDEQKRNEYIQIIQNETKKINELVLAMLEYSKLESRNIVLKQEEVDLLEIVDETLDSFMYLIQKKKIKLNLNLDSVIIQGDRFRLEMVIDNLLSNALRYTQEGKTIHVTLNNERFSVENEGSHIPEEDLAKVWLTFHKVDRARNEEGTGLGLAICKAVLDLHRLKYGVENTERGVLFYFELHRSGE
ncbi:MAG: HAMP domain-containing histidine kinase [Erysipelotrichales bacterium]|nr:HAMP domain-containing histidine kinase [Erysipelotrichales bacterium]